MTKSLTIIFSILILFSCGDATSELEFVFNKIKKIENRNEVLNTLDKESHDFLDQILAMSKSENADSITIISNDYVSPLNTQLLIQSAKLVRPRFPKMNKLDILYLIEYLDLGFLGNQNKSNYDFKEIQESDENSAVVLAKYLAKSAPRKVYVVSSFKFSKENMDWKLNLPSTFSYSEQVLRKLWSKWAGDEESFIKNIIEKGRVEVEFYAPIN